MSNIFQAQLGRIRTCCWYRSSRARASWPCWCPGDRRVAGVDPALIERYFGSKDNLVCKALTPDALLIPPPLTGEEEIAQELMYHFLGDEELDPILALLHSASSGAGRDLLRVLFERDGIAQIANGLSGEDRDVRAAFTLAFACGLFLGKVDVLNRPSGVAPIMSETSP